MGMRAYNRRGSHLLEFEPEVMHYEVVGRAP